METLTTALILGLLSNIHCLGMCGPIAFLLPLNKSTRSTKIAGIVVYNLGRISNYTLLGLLFGVFGQGLRLGKFQQYAAIGFGILILLWIYVPLLTKKSYINGSRLIRFHNFIKSKLGRQLKRSSLRSLFILGILNGLLPCGMVYLAVAGALSTGNLNGGIMFMLFFGLGTLPVMTLVPFYSNRITYSNRIRVGKVLPVLLTIMALAIIIRGLNLGIPYLSPKLNQDKTMVMDCCHSKTLCDESDQ
jgi:uncharacterized protein